MKLIKIITVATLVLFSVNAFAFDKVINITPYVGGSSETFFKIYGNIQGEGKSKLLLTLPKEATKFTVVIPDNCTAYNVVAFACNTDQCSDPSNITSYKVICPQPTSPVLTDSGI